jgi:hypothetical protein
LAFLAQIEQKLVVREKMGKKTREREGEKKWVLFLFWGRRRAREREGERERKKI